MPTADQQKRVFLRVPVKTPAEIYLNNRFYKKIKLADLSTNGLSFLVSPTDTLPDNPEIRFRLARFSRLIKIKLEVKNRVSLPEGLRLGCSFAEISDRDKKRVDKYVCSSVDISFPEQTVNFAAFLCAIDASFRLWLSFLNSYYSATDFGSSSIVSPLSNFSGIALLLYAFLAFLAFIFSSPSVVSKGKIDFILSLFFSGYAFLFLLIKNLLYWKVRLWNLDYLYTNIYLAFQLFLVFYLGFAIIIGVIFLKKVALTLDVIKQEFATLRCRLAQLKFLRKNRIDK
ncbi:PilZ domain-containing protein [Candidatus Omnitrophota bacterium]